MAQSEDRECGGRAPTSDDRRQIQPATNKSEIDIAQTQATTIAQAATLNAPSPSIPCAIELRLIRPSSEALRTAFAQYEVPTNNTIQMFTSERAKCRAARGSAMNVRIITPDNLLDVTIEVVANLRSLVEKR